MVRSAHPQNAPASPAEPETYEQFSVQIGAKSRIVLPAAVRERLGLAEGDRLILRVYPDNTITIISRKEAAARAAGMFRHIAPGVSLADELIRDRREEARRESRSK